MSSLFSLEEETSVLNSVRTQVQQAGLSFSRAVAWEFFLRYVFLLFFPTNFEHNIHLAPFNTILVFSGMFNHSFVSLFSSSSLLCVFEKEINKNKKIFFICKIEISKKMFES